jgi:hypothetical protein
MPQKKSDAKNEQPKERKPASYWFTVIILVVLVAALIIGPLFGGLAPQNTGVIGTYKDYELRLEPGNIYYRNIQNLLARYEQAGQQITEDQNFQVYLQAFNQSVQELALLERAADAGLAVSDETISQSFRSSPDLQDGLGNFSRELFNQLSSAERRRRSTAYEEQLSYQQVLNDLLLSGRLSPSEIDFIVDMAAEKRAFQYVNFDFDTYPIEETKRFALDNLNLFQSREISTITMNDQAQLEDIRNEIIGGTAAFEEKANFNSEDIFAAENGYRGITYFYDLRQDFIDAELAEQVYALEMGDLSEVLPLANGRYVLIRAETPTRSLDTESTDDLINVRDYMLDSESGQKGTIVDYFLTQAELFSQIAATEGFSEAASEFNVPVQQTTAFPINYGNVDFLGQVTDIGGLPLQEEARLELFFEQLFSTPINGVTDSFEFSNSISVYTPIEEVILTESEKLNLETQVNGGILNFFYPQVQSVFVNQDDIQNNLFDLLR